MEDEKLDEKTEEKDSLKSLFESMDQEIFTEAVQLKMATLFEATVNEAVEKKEQELEEANTSELTVFKTDLVEQIDDYMDYFVKDYIKENEVVVEDFSKVKLAEKVLRNFSQMVEAFNMSLSDESVDAEDEIDDLKTECNKLTNSLIESKKEIESVQRAALIAEASEGGTDLQIEKLIESASKVEFGSIELFEGKLETLMEKIINESQTDESDLSKLNESTENTPEDKKETSVSQYLKYLK